MSKYIELNKETFQSTVKEGVSVVDFWAPWCGPCRTVAPIIEQLAIDYDGKAKICKVNADEENELTQEFGVRSIPTMIFFKDGEIVDQILGAVSKATLEEKLDLYL